MKKTQTTLPIDILTDYEHERGNDFERARQQIELAGLYLQSIFNTIKRSALYTDGEFAHDENDTVRNFCGDMIHHAEIGNALLMMIWKNISEMEQPREIEENEIENSDRVLGASETAERLERLLNSDDTPDALKDALFVLLDAESFEQSLTFNDSRIVRQSFPFLLETILDNGGGDAARVFLSAIQNLIDSFPCVKKSEVNH